MRSTKSTVTQLAYLQKSKDHKFICTANIFNWDDILATTKENHKSNTNNNTKYTYTTTQRTMMRLLPPKYCQVVGGWIKRSIDPDYSILENGNSNFIANTRSIEFVTVNLSRWILALFTSPKMSTINSQSKDGINFEIT